MLNLGCGYIENGVVISVCHRNPSASQNQNILITLPSLPRPPSQSFFRHSYCTFWGVEEQKLVIIGQWSSKSTFGAYNTYIHLICVHLTFRVLSTYQTEKRIFVDYPLKSSCRYKQGDFLSSTPPHACVH